MVLMNEGNLWPASLLNNIEISKEQEIIAIYDILLDFANSSSI